MTTPDAVGGRGRLPRGWVLCERGSALIVSMMATTALLILGSALILVAQTETAIAADAEREARTFFAAEAALRYASVDLEALADWTTALSGLATSAMTDGSAAGTHTLGRVTVDLAAARASLAAAAANLPFGANNPEWALFLWGPVDRLLTGANWPGYVAVWMADDGAEADDDPRRDGGAADARGRGVVRLHAVAFDGAGARRSLEATGDPELDGTRPAPHGTGGAIMRTWMTLQARVMPRLQIGCSLTENVR